MRLRYLLYLPTSGTERMPGRLAHLACCCRNIRFFAALTHDEHEYIYLDILYILYCTVECIHLPIHS